MRSARISPRTVKTLRAQTLRLRAYTSSLSQTLREHGVRAQREKHKTARNARNTREEPKRVAHVTGHHRKSDAALCQHTGQHNVLVLAYWTDSTGSLTPSNVTPAPPLPAHCCAG